MRKTFQAELQRRLRQFSPLAPALITLAAILLTLLPRRFLPLADIMPLLPLISLYYWILFRVSLMPFWTAFTLGLISDALSGLPLGLSSLLYLLFWLAVGSQRKIITKETFWTVWFGFTLLSAGYVILYWILLSAAFDRSLPVWTALLQWGLTVGCYPPLHSVCNRVYAALPRAHRA